MQHLKADSKLECVITDFQFETFMIRYIMIRQNRTLRPFKQKCTYPYCIFLHRLLACEIVRGVFLTSVVNYDLLYMFTIQSTDHRLAIPKIGEWQTANKSVVRVDNTKLNLTQVGD